MSIRFATDRPDERGFSLVETMIVVLVISLLIAIAIPVFLGSRSRAQDRAAQANLRSALTGAKTMYLDTRTYANATNILATGLPTVEPSLNYLAAGTASTVATPHVSVAPNGTTSWAAARMSASGRCFTIKDVAASGTRFGSTTTAANCTGTWAGTGTNTNLLAW